ncbi:hypothetical protein JX266_009646 [Neoarthrinium moseri]|nr:hypothetical protein JX266_009646 [Neoarthrinium moseri]
MSTSAPNAPGPRATTPKPTPPPILGSLSEICIVTPSLHSTLDSLTRLGLGPFRTFVFDGTTVTGQELGGQCGGDLYTMRVAFAHNHSGDAREPVLEIMEPVSGATPMRAYLDAHGGRAGVQHVAFGMFGEPMAARRARMGERGFAPAMAGVWTGRRGEARFCFFDTAEQGLPTCFETIEFSGDWEEPACVWYPHPPAEEPGKKKKTEIPGVDARVLAAGYEELLQ